MDWLWPDLLLLLAMLPLIVVIYVWALRRRRFTIRYSSLFFLKDVKPPPSWWRRHLQFTLFLLALASLILALGRPRVPMRVVSERTTILLALDISKSMCLTDIKPNRLEAAKMAARSLIRYQVSGTQVGVVAFARFAELALPPTRDINALEHTINELTTGANTAIGTGILRSIDAIAAVDPQVLKSSYVEESAHSLPDPASPPPSAKAPYVPHIIVLLSDGSSNSGPDPLLAAQQAVKRGVRIYTIGIGASGDGSINCDNRSESDQSLSAGDLTERYVGYDMSPDAATLKQIAGMTGGKFYAASNADELKNVFRGLQKYLALTSERVEISADFVGLAVLLTIVAIVLSML